jgi:hypothetical protein
MVGLQTKTTRIDPFQDQLYIRVVETHHWLLLLDLE